MAGRRRVSRREFITSVGAGTAAFVGGAAYGQRAAAQAGKPNIVVIVSDDHGYADVSCYAHADAVTPGIDRLAAEGVRLTNGYVSCPVCSPTRAGLMTGRYQQRFGYYANPAASVRGLPLEELTLADLLKRAGYATGAVGKWHLGMTPQCHPMKRGFDEFYGFLSGSHDYFDLASKGNNPIYRGLEPIEETGYLTELFTREALGFIERHRREPFFLYLAYNAVHAPVQAPESYLARVKSDDPKRRTYLAMLTCMDDGIGQVLAKLKEVGVDRNTLLIFHSDNGGPLSNGSLNTPLRGRKQQVWEGGVRVPFIVRWPARLPAGRECHEPIIALDILPTCVAAAGGTLPEARVYDGKDMMPALLGRNKQPLYEALYWSFLEDERGEQYAVRRGEWKLVREEGELHLSNLAKDIGEATNLIAEKPQVAKELQEMYAAWRGQMQESWAPRLLMGAFGRQRQQRGEK